MGELVKKLENKRQPVLGSYTDGINKGLNESIVEIQSTKHHLLIESEKIAERYANGDITDSEMVSEFQELIRNEM